MTGVVFFATHVQESEERQTRATWGGLGVCKGKEGQCEIETFPPGTKRSIYELNEISDKRNQTKQTKSPAKKCFSNFLDLKS